MEFTPRWVRIDPNMGIGRHLYGYGEVTSTMDVAWDLADGGATHGAALLAIGQTQGRGRFRRAWVSGSGEALAMSVVLRPPVSVGPYLSIITSLAVRSALRDLAGLRCHIKWPNDVQVGARKLCGILVEARTSTNGQTTAIVGVGLNVNLDTDAWPELQNATSLHVLTGRIYAVVDVAVLVLKHMEAWYRRAEQGMDVIEEWRSALATLGKQVSVNQRDGELIGMAEEVDESGGLLVRTPDGVLHTVLEGDVTLQS